MLLYFLFEGIFGKCDFKKIGAPKNFLVETVCFIYGDIVMHSIDIVLNGEKESVVLSREITPEAIVNYMESHGYEYIIEYNGWQHDFWVKFHRYGIIDYVMSGSWYYGTYNFGVA